jgi:hypothetical protein
MVEYMWIKIQKNTKKRRLIYMDSSTQEAYNEKSVIISISSYPSAGDSIFFKMERNALFPPF